MLMAFSILPWDTSHLADSGTSQGVSNDKHKGADVTKVNSCQFFKYNAIHGSMQAAIVKNIAIDIFATNVRHFGPTYSNTEQKKN